MTRKTRKTKLFADQPTIPVEPSLESAVEVAPVEPTVEVAPRKKRKYTKRKKKAVEPVLEPVLEQVPVVEPAVEQVPVPVTEPVTKPVKVKKIRKVKDPNRIKRAPSKYNLYISQQMKTDSIKKLNPKLRFSQISKNWSAHKASLAEGIVKA